MYVLACSQHQAAAKMAHRARERRAALHKARLEGLRKIHEDVRTIINTEIDHAKEALDGCLPFCVRVSERTIEFSPLESEKELDP